MCDKSKIISFANFSAIVLTEVEEVITSSVLYCSMRNGGKRAIMCKETFIEAIDLRDTFDRTLKHETRG